MIIASNSERNDGISQLGLVAMQEAEKVEPSGLGLNMKEENVKWFQIFFYLNNCE